MTEPVQRIVVLGRDAPLWLAALALERAFGPAGVTVTALEVPTFLENTDAYATVPAMASLHAAIGFDEAVFAGLCNGVPLVGQRFANWSRTRHAFVHGYDAAPPQGDRFPQYWLRARAAGLTVPNEDFSLAAVAARQGRVPTPETASGELAAGFGYQVGAEAYAGLLKHYAARRGIAHRTGRVADVEMAGDRIAALAWQDGERFEAELFVDATGPEAILAGRMDGAAWEPWGGWLPCDRMLTASGTPLKPLPAFAQLSAFRAGWFRLEPLQDRTAVTACFGAEHLTGEMIDNIDVLAGIHIEGDAVIGSAEPGLRARPWAGNCVALGGAALRLEPLYPVELPSVHIGIQQLVTCLAAAGGTMAGADAYNQAFAAHAANLRDFQALHYRLNRRIDDPFWDAAREAPLPPSLQEKLDAFAATGEVPVGPQEALQADEWAAAFIGHGLVPGVWPAAVDDLTDQELMARLQHRLREIARLVAAMPTVEEHVAAAAARRKG